MRLTDTDIDGIRARHDLASVAGRYVALRKAGRGLVGPCPICSRTSTSRTASRFEVKGERWVCAVCEDGGDVIGLVMKAEGRDFRAALEQLGEGHLFAPRDPAERARAGAEAKAAMERRAAARAADEAREAAEREDERARLYDIWRNASPITAGGPVWQYLAGRGIDVGAAVKAGLRLRQGRLDWHGPEGEKRAAQACMLAAFQDAAGRFTGLHITWLAEVGGAWVKASKLPGCDAWVAKKMRGIKAGSSLRLIAPEAPVQMICGEGIETTLSPFTALARAGRDLARIAFVAAGDLGNMAGRAAGTEQHPTLRHEDGRPVRIPNTVPDMTAPCIPVPESVADLVLLGDGDSERELTMNTLVRAGKRHALPGRRTRVMPAPEGRDWNDVLRGGGSGSGGSSSPKGDSPQQKEPAQAARSAGAEQDTGSSSPKGDSPQQGVHP
jgi:hypothetical protein